MMLSRKKAAKRYGETFYGRMLIDDVGSGIAPTQGKVLVEPENIEVRNMLATALRRDSY